MSQRKSFFARFRDFWTHPTIAEMQAEMLRNIPAIHAHRKLARRIDKVNRRVLGDAHDLIAGMYGYESDLDRITRLWAPTARQVCEAFAERGPFGNGENAFEKAAREHNHREEATRCFATRRTQWPRT